MKPLLLGLLLALAFPTLSFCADPAPDTRAAPVRRGKPRFEGGYEQRTFKGSGDAEFKYGWLAPLNQKPGEKYPLVICLHGAGGNTVASQVLIRPNMREKYPAFLLIGQAEPPAVWAFDELLAKRRGRTDRPPEKMPALLEAVRSLLKSEPIDPARVYITGQSMGGVGSWGAIARAPEIFAAAVPVCGAWAVEDVPKMVPVPVWAFHGEKDNLMPTQFSRDLTAALTKAGGSAKYTEYPGVGHDSWTKAYDDAAMWEWMFAQRKPQQP